ncbi:hypothetical protein H2200_005544 [Cladophialophora chaetospira]|uniref:Aminoglycoside phosphotransferase domain-containing protein n=1 Tax=Cladophialophora chaetospira TaxID=386627 RepID=A0AA38XCB2_9EURO|nr:hypothetical protein H2200_005544 [Cladophialophora chaetospira]
MATQSLPALLGGRSYLPKVDVKDIENIARRHLDIQERDSVEIVCRQRSDYDGLDYRIYKNDYALAKISVYTQGTHPEKIASISATKLWLKQNTTVPLSLCITSVEDEIHGIEYDWQLGLFYPDCLKQWGLQRLDLKWDNMAMDVKEQLIKSLAHYHSQALRPRNKFKSGGIGSITYRSMYDSRELLRRRLVAKHLKTFEVRPSQQNGPVLQVSAWLRVRLNQARVYAEEYIPASIFTYGVDDEEIDLTSIERLQTMISTIFSPEINEIKETVLWDPYFYLDKIMVSNEGKLAAFDSMLEVELTPLWSCYRLPRILFGPDRAKEPVKDHYNVDKSPPEITSQIDNDPEYEYSYDPDVEEDEDGELVGEERARLRSLYPSHLEEYSRTKLRKVYLETMESLHPGFQHRMKHYELFNDFDTAVWLCEAYPGGHAVHAIEKWLDALEARNYYSLARNLKGDLAT